MIERRTQTRVEINQPAMLHFDGIRGDLPCIVRNIHDQGARIDCPFYIFSREFDLSADGFITSTRCHVVWRRETTCGVAFIRQYAKHASTPDLPGAFTAQTDPAKRRGT